jgi:LAS superfamily LD-carboxypeptidase LdcB
VLSKYPILKQTPILVARILTFILACCSLFILVSGSFGASGDIHSELPLIESIKRSTVTGTVDVSKKTIRTSIKKRFKPQEAYTDTSLLRFVSRSVPLADMGYIPAPLVSISGAHINQAGRSSHLRKDARDALWDLARAFEDEFKTPLIVISGYRSAAYQQRLWDLGRCTDSLCAPP